MNEVFILYSYRTYEGRDNLRAFKSRERAEQVEKLCEEHLSQEPICDDLSGLPDDEYERKYTKWEKARKRWEKKAPIPGCDYAHGFGVEGLNLDAEQ